VFELDITPNRPDAMSMAGVARDLAAAYRIPFTLPALELSEGRESATALASVVVEDYDLCPLFVVRTITDVEVGDSPDWVQRRLVLAGMRPINSVVDASNYVMLELGQPNHPYDLDRLSAPGLRVRAARAGETVQTLDGVVRAVGLEGNQDCLICDAENRPVGLAGIMGGESSEISESTRRILLEVAYFDPMAIARTSKRLGLRTEASARFERGVDPGGAEVAADRVCGLITASGPAQTSAGRLVEGEAPPRPHIRLRTDRVNAILGTALAPDAVRAYLEPIGFSVAGGDGGVSTVVVPGWRPDVTAEIDLVEEVARHHGYSHIARTVPTTTQVGALSRLQRERRLVREVMVGCGLIEVWTPSLLGPDDHAAVGMAGRDATLANPMSREETVLRRSMLPGILRALRYNAGHRNRDLRVFEVGRVFSEDGGGVPTEREVLSVALNGAEDDATAAVRVWRTLAGVLRLEVPRLDVGTAPGLHSTRTAAVAAGSGVALGFVGEVDPVVIDAFDLEGRVGWLEIDLGALHGALRRPASVEPVSVYPSSDIDLAFSVEDAVPAGEVEGTLRRAGGNLLVGLWLFDVYRDEEVLGPDRRSLAFRLRFCAPDRTLTDAEVAEVRTRCVTAVESAHPARLRG